MLFRSVATLEAMQGSAKAYTSHPALLRLEELEALREIARSPSARIYVGFDKQIPDGDGGHGKGD